MENTQVSICSLGVTHSTISIRTANSTCVCFLRRSTAKRSCCCGATWSWSTWASSWGPPSSCATTLRGSSRAKCDPQPGHVTDVERNKRISSLLHSVLMTFSITRGPPQRMKNVSRCVLLRARTPACRVGTPGWAPSSTKVNPCCWWGVGTQPHWPFYLKKKKKVCHCHKMTS